MYKFKNRLEKLAHGNERLSVAPSHLESLPKQGNHVVLASTLHFTKHTLQRKITTVMLAFTLIFTGIFTFSNCDKLRELRVNELSEIIKEEIKNTPSIVKELPKMRLSGDLNGGEYAVIQSQAELLAIFPQGEIDKSPDLQAIDFDTQTLLIGRDNYQSFAVFNYAFYWTGKNQYTFEVEIFGNYAMMDYCFLHGIVITKLPVNAKVIFIINKRINIDYSWESCI